MALGSVFALGACSNDPVSSSASGIPIDLLPDFAVSNASEVDGGGIGAALLPDSIKLSVEQKAAIEALHDAFTAAHKADFDALKAIEAEAKAARQAGKTRADVMAIMAKAKPILETLHTAFAALQDAIWAIYTPAQQAWIDAHRSRICGPTGAPPLSDAQVQQIRDLRQAFADANKADIDLIKAVRDEAKAAREAGKTNAEIQAILARASAAMDRVHAAEKKLQQDVMNVLTPEQRARWCVVRPHGMRHG
jgi:hypothetical protein